VSRTVAAFDFDGTLTRQDTLWPFLASIVGRPKLALALLQESPSFALLILRRRSRDDVKERLLTRVLAGHSVVQVAAIGDEYGSRLGRSAITPPMLARIRWHQNQGHEVVIVSATLEPYLGAVARTLGVEHLLCTQLEADAAGCLTGKIVGANCRGHEKARQLRAHIGNDEVELWAYGNSRGDDAMLAMADHPVRVRRGKPTQS
jgi:HAD superfamily hydrolase (TIGR01490 family)